jgi:hypothetical protein
MAISCAPVKAKTTHKSLKLWQQRFIDDRFGEGRIEPLEIINVQEYKP